MKAGLAESNNGGWLITRTILPGYLIQGDTDYHVLCLLPMKQAQNMFIDASIFLDTPKVRNRNE